MTNLLDAQPPDDTGTDTLKRFRYQAQLAFPFCLDCALGGSVRSVIMEHFEDIVVEYPDHWRFIQVKSRNDSRGPWRLTDAMDGLKSLHRAYKNTSHLNAKYSLFLEGAIASADDLNKLVPIKPVLDDALCLRVMASLSISRAECDAFLALTTVIPNQPPREHVVNQNIRLLSKGNANTAPDELEAIETRVTDEILRAMSQERLEALIPSYIEKPDDMEEELRRRVDDKHMTPTRLTSLFGSLVAGAFPLLRRLVNPSLSQPTNLEKKLVAAGATPAIIRNAQELRANASIREAEVASSALFGNKDKMDDVHHRVEIVSNAVVAQFENLETQHGALGRRYLNR